MYLDIVLNRKAFAKSRQISTYLAMTGGLQRWATLKPYQPKFQKLHSSY